LDTKIPEEEGITTCRADDFAILSQYHKKRFTLALNLKKIRSRSTEKIIFKLTQKPWKQNWKRYIDDVLYLREINKQVIDLFIQANASHSTTKVTAEILQHEIT